MRKFLLALTLIVLIAVIPCLIENLRTGSFSGLPGIFASLFISPAAIVYLVLIETKLSVWIPRSALALYSIFLIYTGISALGAELHGPLLAYWLVPATIIFIPTIFTLPHMAFYRTSQRVD